MTIVVLFFIISVSLPSVVIPHQPDSGAENVTTPESSAFVVKVTSSSGVGFSNNIERELGPVE